MMTKNKKSNIPVTVLVIMTLLLCTIAMMSFLFDKDKVIDIISGVFLVEKMNFQIEYFSVSGDLRVADTNINDEGKIVFYQEKKSYSGFLFWRKEKTALSVEYPLE